MILAEYINGIDISWLSQKSITFIVVLAPLFKGLNPSVGIVVNNNLICQMLRGDTWEGIEVGSQIDQFKIEEEQQQIGNSQKSNESIFEEDIVPKEELLPEEKFEAEDDGEEFGDKATELPLSTIAEETEYDSFGQPSAHELLLDLANRCHTLTYREILNEAAAIPGCHRAQRITRHVCSDMLRYINSELRRTNQWKGLRRRLPMASPLSACLDSREVKLPLFKAYLAIPQVNQAVIGMFTSNAFLRLILSDGIDPCIRYYLCERYPVLARMAYDPQSVTNWQSHRMKERWRERKSYNARNRQQRDAKELTLLNYK